MSTIEPYRPSVLPTQKVGRALARLSDQTEVGTAVTQAKADLETAKVDGIASVSQRAMQDVALLSQVEQSLAQTVPHASGRLATIADLTAIALADVVSTSARRIGR